MATNLDEDVGIIKNVAATAPAAPTSGDPCVIGVLPAVALTDEGGGGNDAGNITADTRNGVQYRCPVKGANNAGNTAIAVGDKIYYDSTELNVDATNGVPWGYALEVVGSGNTTTIRVRLGL